MSQFVFSGALCQCALGGVGTVTAAPGRVRNAAGQKMLTETDFPVLSGACSATYPPTPCVYAPGQWRNVSLKVHCGGRRPLLSNSQCACLRGGTVFFTAVVSNVRNVGGANLNADGASRSAESGNRNADGANRSADSANRNADSANQNADSASRSAESGNRNAGGANLNAESGNRNADGANRSAESASRSADGALPDAVTENASGEQSASPERERDTGEQSASAEREDGVSRKGICSGECPEAYRRHCPFLETPCAELINPNSSDALAKNLRQACPGRYEDAVEFIERIAFTARGVPVHCSVAHHHLIPGNQCLTFKNADGSPAYPLLIRLCNFYGYNVNCAENGILLPTIAGTNFAALSALSPREKTALFYSVMTQAAQRRETFGGLTGAQLHIGHHDYPEQRRRLGRIKPEIRLYETYARIVRERLQRLETAYQDRSEEICYMDGGGEARFLARMRGVSDAMRESVLRFPREKGDRGWMKNRAYVSFPALAYDFGVTWEEYARCFYPGE